MDRIVKQFEADDARLSIIRCVQSLSLPDCYLAAGFVRNFVWDYLHDKSTPALLNDIDVIYFDSNESTPDQFKAYERRLKAMKPHLNWQVRNQAFMHLRNNDKPYVSSVDAMRFWPEKETSIGIRMLSDGSLECISAFGVESLFNLQVSHNPKRLKSIFEQRLNSKGWLKTWPKLSIAP